MSVFDVDGKTELRQLFDHQLDAGLHHGAQLAVYEDGEQIVDFAGGTAGPDEDAETSDRKHLLFSCTKPYAGACLHHLIDAGAASYDDKVTDHWPAYADPSSTRDEATIRHVLSHQAGVPASPVDERPDAWGDWDAVAELLATVEPSFTPGETAAYHALSYGWLVGLLVREIAGETVGSYAREHLFDPLGMDDTHIGLPASESDDVATLVGFESFDRCRDADAGLQTMTNAEAAALFNQEHVHRAEVPAASGVGTASDMARFYACLADGGSLDGTRVLSESIVDELTSCQTEVESDGTLGSPTRYGLGVFLAGHPTDKYGTFAPDHVFGHGGLGSSLGWADPESGIAAAYVTNGIRDEFEHGSRTTQIADAVRAMCAE